MALPRLIQEAQHIMMRRYTLATLARMLAPHLRHTDMIIEDRTPGRLLIIASDTCGGSRDPRPPHRWADR